MRLGIIGAGNVGRVLGLAWARVGHQIRWGVPDPANGKYAELGADRLSIPAAAAADAEVVVLATPWDATEAAVRSLGSLARKTVIDCTNPLAIGPDGLGLALGHGTSGGEMVAGWAQGASVFKTLNQTGAENMARAHAFTVRPLMFVAGDDAVRKPIVLRLVGDLGFEAVDAGPLRIARLLEPYAMLWIDQALTRGAGRDFAFARIRRPD
jgi:8-hydroxy-5-deazaflavin:NADPH oxidoreductase